MFIKFSCFQGLRKGNREKDDKEKNLILLGSKVYKPLEILIKASNAMEYIQNIETP